MQHYWYCFYYVSSLRFTFPSQWSTLLRFFFILLIYVCKFCFFFIRREIKSYIKLKNTSINIRFWFVSFCCCRSGVFNILFFMNFPPPPFLLNYICKINIFSFFALLLFSLFWINSRCNLNSCYVAVIIVYC